MTKKLTYSQAQEIRLRYTGVRGQYSALGREYGVNYAIVRRIIEGELHRNPEELLVERFWSYVDISGDCWLWQGAINQYGYGQFHMDRRPIGAHVFSWMLHSGRKPLALVCHHCDVRACCKFEHLFEGTHKDNSDDKILKNRHFTKLSLDEVKAILVAHKTAGETCTSLANRFGVSKSYVASLCAGRYRRLELDHFLGN